MATQHGDAPGEGPRALPAELVVVDAAGRLGGGRSVLGPVAEAVVRPAPCSTPVVRPRAA